MMPLVVQRRSRFPLFALLFLLLVIVGGVAYLGWRQSVPGVRVGGTPPRFIGGKTPIALELEAARGQIARAEVRVVQAGKSTVVARQDTPVGKRGTLTATVEGASLGLREGEAVVEVWARDDFWRPLRHDDRLAARFPVTVDLTPPKLEILAATPYVAPGGSGLVVFRAEGATNADVRVGSVTFASFPYGPPERGARIAFLALPWDFKPGTALTVAAQDEAGNAATRGIPGEVLPRRFPHDRIEVKDAFLQLKVPELLPQRPANASLIDGFLIINRDQRKQAEEEKRRVGAKSADHALWEGPFVQPRNTKVFANFAESRSYVYNGREVDTQVHFGYDLASTKHSPVPAANKGVVAFAGPLTIYGNAVILDHGLGLQTLYAHLSSIGVNVGDSVDKGHELGRTGTTGLAIGDHLHYEVLIHGVSVTPLEWWDAKWIRDRVAKPLAQANLPTLGGVDAGATTAAATDEAPKPAAPRRTRRSR
jgi:murein DD-endopeptidase MepM/ murein hydrolase activator NlpD